MVAEASIGPSGTLSLPDALPVLPLRGGTVVFPFVIVPLLIGQPRSIQIIDDVMRRERLLTLVGQTNERVEQPGPDDLRRIGTAGIIHQLVRTPEGALRLVVQGLERVRILDFISTEPYLVARAELAPDRASPGIEIDGLRRAAIDLFRRVASLADEVPAETAAAAEALADPRHVCYLIASVVPLPPLARQEILELDPLEAKLQRLIELLQQEIAIRELGQKITAETQQRLSKAQHDYYLREQLRSIQRELGEGEDDPELAQLRRKLADAGLPDEARREAERELERLATLPQISPEYGLIRTYLDWMVSLPWNVLTGGDIDVARARQVLDDDHYDLDKVKDRILEHLAVTKLREDRRVREQLDEDAAGPAAETPVVDEASMPNVRTATPTDESARETILCFVGPPGVGKTSLGHSIARALQRKFVRMSLGGVRDEAEIARDTADR